MEILLIVLSMLLVAGGVVFSVIPPLPGPLLSYAALFSTHALSKDTQFDNTSFVIWGIIGLAIIIADYALPIAATRKFGGTKAGVIGGLIGTIAGLILPIPFGIIVGPLLGAIIGDLYGGNHFRMALKSGFGSFLGFIIATLIKVGYSIVLGGVIVWRVGGFTFKTISALF